MKVLLTFVGLQDPVSDKTGEEGSIVTLCRQKRPDVVLMLPSAEVPGRSGGAEAGNNARNSTEQNAHDTKELLVSRYGFKRDGIFIRPLTLINPTDFLEILPAGRREIAAFLDSLRGCGELEIMLNTSSGTPQMKSCWFLWSAEGLFADTDFHLYQVINPEVSGSGSRIKEVSYQFVDESNAIRRIREYLDKCMFLAAAEEAKNLARISAYSTRRDRARLLRQLCLAYHSWDLLKYGEAYDVLNRVLDDYRGSADLKNLLDMLAHQMEVLGQLRAGNSEETVYNLTDIYYNAQRRYAQGDYASSLARVWRTLEGVLYYRLRQLGINPRDVSSSPNQKNADTLIEKIRGLKHNPQVTAAEAMRALEILNDGEYKNFMSRDMSQTWRGVIQGRTRADAYEELRKLRNTSVVAHGMSPVVQDVSRVALDAGKELLRLTFKREIIVNDYPFDHEKVMPCLYALVAQMG